MEVKRANIYAAKIKQIHVQVFQKNRECIINGLVI